MTGVEILTFGFLIFCEMSPDQRLHDDRTHYAYEWSADGEDNRC
jgi:hypothetical protein